MEVLRLSWKALWERKGRTIGAIIGVVIAFTALSYALLLGQTFKDYTERFFTSNFQTNLLYVTGAQFTDADVAVFSTISGVETAIPVASTRGMVRVPGSSNPVPVTVYGIDQNYIRQILPPTALYDGEVVLGSNLALVGYYVAFDRNTGRQRLSLSSPVSMSIGRKSTTVVASGILATGSLGFVDTARGVILDLSTFRQLTGITSYNLVIVLLRDPSQIDQVSNDIRANFPNVDVISPQAILQTINNFLTSFQLFLGLIAGVSTVITAMWLYDTMSISVVQRTKEIGILRSIGFKKRQIMALFLGEALMIAILGIAIGLVVLIPLSNMGMPFSQQQAGGPGGPPGRLAPGASFANITSLVLDPLIVAATAILVLAVNLAGAFLPAYRASRIDIVSALRYE